MKTATVVIGAGYGDEGKGLATDYYAAAAPESLVVRFNGGAQAGHTVVDGSRRHVFSHFGSGTLAGAETFLSRFFVCHPMLFAAERAALTRLGVVPRVTLDPRAPVSTPFDVMINQMLEASRGGGRHGSCGIGFGETIEREEKSPFTLRAEDLADPALLARRLRQIRDQYVPRRLGALGLPALSRELASDAVIDRFVEDAGRFLAAVRIEDWLSASAGRPLLFEGAQGLLLDMDRGAFPHVTRSSTGLKNVVLLAREAAVDGLSVTYATRAYVTRHGDGPLRHELAEKPFEGIEDRTNLDNAWQGALRFGWLDLDVLEAAIGADLGDGGGLVRRVTLLVTCLDQIDADATVIVAGRRRTVGRDGLVAALNERLAADAVLASYGPSRGDVVQWSASSRRPAKAPRGPSRALAAVRAVSG